MDSLTTKPVTPAAQKKQTIRELLDENLKYGKAVLFSTVAVVVCLFLMMFTHQDAIAGIILIFLAVVAFCVCGILVNGGHISKLFRELDDIERLEALEIRRKDLSQTADI